MINYIRGDLFTHIPKGGSIPILAHACNPHGRWGAGVATVFKSKFKSTFTIHQKYCETHENLLGNCQLIGSDGKDKGNKDYEIPAYIGCLFTADLGRKQSPEEIVRYTETSLHDLVKQLNQLNLPFEKQNGKYIVNIPKINSGLFFTPWEMTETILNKFEEELVFNVYVLE